MCSKALFPLGTQNEKGKTQNKLCIYSILAQGKKMENTKTFDFSLFPYNSMQNEIGKRKISFVFTAFRHMAKKEKTETHLISHSFRTNPCKMK